VCKALQRLGIKRKQGRLHLHSPDRAYLTKLGWIERASALAGQHPDTVSLLYADEWSFYRRPPTAGAGVYYPRAEEPTCQMYPGYNTYHRVGAALDAYTGRVVWLDDEVVGVKALCRLLSKIRERYGPERTIFLVWDNWHVHYQREVAAKASELGIQLLWLPTYAPWTNPIEKMWRWLTQTHIRNHSLSGQFDTLVHRVRSFLERFEHGSAELLRYVGLESPSPIT
jgi:transposase